MEKQIFKRIVADSGIMAGKPIIRGTRVPVDLIAELLAQGMTKKEILEDYPNISEEDIFEVLRYMAELVKGETTYTINLENE